ncbi:tRNA methyltransferase 10 homolog B isoform X3 [Emydura macquarii macquarii]|uniref:tRNA methyltransferase 10 homolog B isoform X3 n=1 Tax=Emydura macquarii macquarii TaxID=1129001 RepID=UPI00352AA218
MLLLCPEQCHQGDQVCAAAPRSSAGRRAAMRHAEHGAEESDPAVGFDRQWECGLAWQDDAGDGESICESFQLLQIDMGCDNPKDLPVGSGKWCSRNVLRKQRHWEKIVAAKKKKRKQEKERRKAKHAEDKGAAHQHSKRVLKAITKERLLAAKEAAPQLCVDLSMTSHMTKKEISRLAAQIRRLYGSNKKAVKPFWICLTGFVTGSPIYEECLRMNDGFSNYLMDTTQESYLDLFPLETIVYLTPDSENGLDSALQYELRIWSTTPGTGWHLQHAAQPPGAHGAQSVQREQCDGLKLSTCLQLICYCYAAERSA